MTPTEQAEALALKCSDEIGGASTYIADARTIKEICCLVEFFEVVKAAEDYTTEREYQNVEHCRRDMNAREQVLLNAITALRDKLPKEVL